jgi:hypothetical protein
MIESGTASGHNDFLIKMHDFLVDDCGWTEMDYVLPSPLLDTSVVSFVLRAPGAASGHEYFLYARTTANIGSGFYGIGLRSSTDYDSSLLIGSQTMISPEVFYNLWQNATDYWFYGNTRRIIAVAKVNTSYVSMYAGLFLPFAIPSQYAKPFFIGGNYVSLEAYDVSNTRNRFIADPGNGCAYYLNRDVTDWLKVSNHDTGTTTTGFSILPESIMWPHRGIRTTVTEDDPADINSWNSNGMGSQRPLLGGEHPQYMCHIISGGGGERKVVGAMEGLYSVPGFGITSEQVLSVGSPPRTFRNFQNVFRTTPRDFMSVEEV